MHVCVYNEKDKSSRCLTDINFKQSPCTWNPLKSPSYFTRGPVHLVWSTFIWSKRQDLIDDGVIKRYMLKLEACKRRRNANQFVSLTVVCGGFFFRYPAWREKIMIKKWKGGMEKICFFRYELQDDWNYTWGGGGGLHVLHKCTNLEWPQKLHSVYK